MSTITLTERAALRINEIMTSEPEGSMLRISVNGGGCSGFQYAFDVEKTQGRRGSAHRPERRRRPDRRGLGPVHGGRGDRLRRRPHGPVVQDREPPGDGILRLRHLVLALTAPAWPVLGRSLETESAYSARCDRVAPGPSGRRGTFMSVISPHRHRRCGPPGRHGRPLLRARGDARVRGRVGGRQPHGRRRAGPLVGGDRADGRYVRPRRRDIQGRIDRLPDEAGRFQGSHGLPRRRPGSLRPRLRRSRWPTVSRGSTQAR